MDIKRLIKGEPVVDLMGRMGGSLRRKIMVLYIVGGAVLWGFAWYNIVQQNLQFEALQQISSKIDTLQDESMKKEFKEKINKIIGEKPLVNKWIIKISGLWSYNFYPNAGAWMIILLTPSIVLFALWFTNIFYIAPLVKMTRVSAKVTEGDLNQEVNIKTNDELEVLGHTINNMVASLRNIIEYQRTEIGRLLEAVNALASGDLTREVQRNSDDEFGQLADSFNVMAGNLSTLVAKVDGAASRVEQAVQDILMAAEQQAAGVTEQASQISEVASSIQELTATAKQISESAQAVADSASRASQAANSGGQSVENSVLAMQKINQTVQATAKKIKALGEQSRKIGKVVTTISEIAEQINLLALNAAIEAARAGEQGRGFAVVADEVRKLAERSTQFTEEINQLISGIQSETNSTVMAMEEGTKSVEEGVNLINLAGDSLSEIISLVSQTTELSREISLSTDQQTRGNEQVSFAMSNLSQAVKQTELSARQTASSAQELSELARELKNTTEEILIKKS